MASRHRATGICRQFLLVFLVAMSLVAVAGAEDINLDILPSTRLDVTPSLQLEQGWDSNIFNTSAGETSDFFFRARPELALRWNTPGAGIRLAGSVEQTWYYSHPSADQDATFDVTIDLTGGQAVQISPTLSLVPSVYYLNTVNSSRRTQLLPSGNPVLPPVTIATYANARSDDFGGGLSFNYKTSPNISLGVYGKYGERRFSGDNTAGLTNSKTEGGGVSVSNLFTPLFSAGLTVSGSHETFENNPNADILSTGILFGYQINPVSRIDGIFGVSYTRQAPAYGIPEKNTSAPSGNMNFSYVAESFTIDAYASGNYSSGSGYSGIARQGTVGLNIRGRYDREWSWNLSGAYQISESAFDSNAIKLNTTYGNMGVQYRLWEWASMGLIGNFDRQTSDEQSGSTLNNYTATLGITIGKSYNVF